MDTQWTHNGHSMDTTMDTTMDTIKIRIKWWCCLATKEPLWVGKYTLCITRAKCPCFHSVHCSVHCSVHWVSIMCPLCVHCAPVIGSLSRHFSYHSIALTADDREETWRWLQWWQTNIRNFSQRLMEETLHRYTLVNKFAISNPPGPPDLILCEPGHTAKQ